MKIALVHDYLNQLGGGERVLDVLLEMFPEADVYTLLHDPKKTQGRYTHRITGTSFLDFQFARDHHRLFIPFMAFAASSINLGGRYDLIISDTAGFAKGIRYDREKTKHISYIHTPLRYAWETKTYFDGSIKDWLIKFFGAPAFWFLRLWDKRMAQRPDALLANSRYIAEKVKRYYSRDAEVAYPPVSDFWFAAPANNYNLKAKSYYLAAGRLLHYKRFDLIIDACARAGVPLKIAGEGPELESLMLKANSYTLRAPIEFLNYVKDEELRNVYAGAHAFIMANEEDFGLVMAEAQACGTPIIAYKAGGAVEIVAGQEAMSGQRLASSGLFFDEQTIDSLASAIKSFEGISFDRDVISKNAERFKKEKFVEAIKKAVEAIFK